MMASGEQDGPPRDGVFARRRTANWVQATKAVRDRNTKTEKRKGKNNSRKGEWDATHHILQQSSHESATQLLAEADDAILGARIDLEVEALSGNDVFDKLLALVLDRLDEGVPQLGILDEGLGR